MKLTLIIGYDQYTFNFDLSTIKDIEKLVEFLILNHVIEANYIIYSSNSRKIKKGLINKENYKHGY